MDTSSATSLPGQCQPDPAGSRTAGIHLGIVVLLAAVLFAIRLTAPSDLLDQDQERPAAYVLDVVKNGNWVCQRDWSGDVTSKPPLWTWLAASMASLTGKVDLLALYWPGAAGGLGCALLVYAFGRKVFGARAAFLGAVACLLTTAGAKQLGLARTDGVFAFTVTLTALLAYRAWRTGGGWTWVWFAAAAATLTKGPVGPVLAAFGLLAVVWERKYGTPHPVRGSHWIGLALFLAIVLGWFLLAYAQLGEALTSKMLGKELVGHAVRSDKGSFPGSMIYKQPLYYLGRAAPWSLLAYLALWRVWNRPSVGTEERRLERFLACWFACGLPLFSLAPHQRADLLWPILPAGALLAGRELDRIARRNAPRTFAIALGVAMVLGVAGLAAYYFHIRARAPFVRQTGALQTMANAIRQTGSPEFPITYLDAPMTLQISLNTLRPPVSAARAAALLRGPEAAFVAVNDLQAIEKEIGSQAPELHRVLTTPVFVKKKAVTILSNRPAFALDPTEPYAFCFGTLYVRAQGAQLTRATQRELRFLPIDNRAEIVLLNEANQPVRSRVALGAAPLQEKLLQPGETWTVRTPGLEALPEPAARLSEPAM